LNQDMTDLVALQGSSDRLVRTVDGLSDDDLAAPSLLPGWSRGHVVAHLALNGEGLAGALEGVVNGEPVPMYASQEARERDIAELATASADQLRARLMAAVTRFADAAGRITGEHEDDTFPRVPGGPDVLAGAAADHRRVEVEVHHTDLGADYGPGDWPAEFCVHLLDAFTGRRPHWQPPFVADPADASGTWDLGATDARSPVVSGPIRGLVAWVTGRGDGAQLSSTTGTLPTIGKW
jgi:maleylpyruvate isomerase